MTLPEAGVTIGVGIRNGIVTDIGIEVQCLRESEIGVGDSGGAGGPIRREPAGHAGIEITRAEVIVAGFRVALLPREVQWAGIAARAGTAVTIAERNICACFDGGTGVVGADAFGAEPVGMREVGCAVRVGSDVFSPGKDLPAVPRP